MKINFARNVLEIEDARIIFRNFAGVASKFNREGNRNFSILIPNEEIANELIEDGWNVKIRPPREDGDAPFMHLPVKIQFNSRGPAAYVISGNNPARRLNEDTIGMLDEIDIASVNMDIRPYDWDVNGKQGRAAYLQAIEVIQNVDRFAARHQAEELPF